MSWVWRFETPTGAVVDPSEVGGTEFSAQGDAESWLGEIWRDLVDKGVGQVFLLEDGREVYGPMSLEAQE
ncbi:hypothetical protein ACIA49_14290 [Kribbella sp. NPDC051587]|jgi:hypothetical protein|uniref:hypothetical protein n=1 Tax=Kribbella sp. NPDC051587 TaxID=3364119 RepID=UPI0037A1BF97